MIKDIHTIWLRDFRTLLSAKIDIIVSFIWPLLIIFVLGIGVDSFIDTEVMGMSYTAFLGPGVIAMMAMMTGTGVGFTIIQDKEGFIKEMLIAPISRASIIIGKILGTMTTNFLMLIVVILVFLIYTGTLSLQSLIFTVGFALLISFLSHGIGILLATFFKSHRVYAYVIGFVYMWLIFLSGIFFPIGGLPWYIKFFSYINPLTYGVDAIRWASTGVSEFSIIFNIIMLIVWGVVLVGLGSYLFERNLKK